MKLSFALLTAACNSSTSGVADSGMCQQRTSLVDHQQWTLVSLTEDPFASKYPDGGPSDDVSDGAIDSVPRLCAISDVHPAKVSYEEAFAITTRYCDWATVTQTSATGVSQGETLAVRVWYFSQDARAGATEAHVIVSLGEWRVIETVVALPTTGGLLNDEITASMDVSAGAPIFWHVDNKGANEYDFIELSVTKKIACPGHSEP